ncbi:folylpolyglutamate synthase [Myotisia sp. PD_48]|nr:folylpolyglutamate synthase [Myotisia sp. PD_48]
MIELGLSRISRLVQQKSLSWKAIHIAGTNGKGSIAGCLSTMLAKGGVRCGAFTSPHLVDRWDCITVNDRVVQEPLFRRIEAEIKNRDRILGIGASEFELLTATAFEIFDHENVDVGVVEVGLGGRLDATNVLTNVLVSIIAKIGLDHQNILGSTLEEIAKEKAGIMRPGTPCVVDGSNAPTVKQVIKEHAENTTTPLLFVDPSTAESMFPSLHRRFDEIDPEPHQQSNIAAALTALNLALPHIQPSLNVDQLIPFIPHNLRAGRQQMIDLFPLIPRRENVLLDGAHNAQSSEALASYVDRKLRRPGGNITWMVAASQGKDLPELFGGLIKPGDNVAVVQFGPVDGMPWVRSVPTTELLSLVGAIPGIGSIHEFGEDILQAIRWSNEFSEGKPIVIAGSLYLVSDVLRLLRQHQSAKRDTELAAVPQQQSCTG